MREQLTILGDLIAPYLNPWQQDELEQKALLIRAQAEEIFNDIEPFTAEETALVLTWLPERLEQTTEAMKSATFNLLLKHCHDVAPVIHQLHQEADNPREPLLRLLEQLASTPSVHLEVPAEFHKVWCWRGLMQPGVAASTDLQALVMLATLQVADRDGYPTSQDWVAVSRTLLHSSRYEPPFQASLDHLETAKLYFVQALAHEQAGQKFLIPSRQPRLTRFPLPGSPVTPPEGRHRFLLTTQQDYTDLGVKIRRWAETSRGAELGKTPDLQVERIMKQTWRVTPAYNQFILTGAKGSTPEGRTNIHAGASCHESRELTLFSYEANDMEVTEPSTVEATVVWGDKPPPKQAKMIVLWSGKFILPKRGGLFFVNPIQGRKPSAHIPVPETLAGEEVRLTVSTDHDGGHGKIFLFWFQRAMVESQNRTR